MLKKHSELLTTNDVVNLLTKHLNLNLQQKGKNLLLICPFHDDKTPSLNFEPNRKFFKCFSCNFFAQDIVYFWTKFKYKKEQINQEEINSSLEEIGKLGYSSLVESLKLENERKKIHKEELNNLFYLLVLIFQNNLSSSLGLEFFNYLQKERGLNIEMINFFSLGCTISNKQISNLFFSKENNNDFWAESLLKNGIVQINDKKQIYDYFSVSQLIIPLKNEEGKIIALAARKQKVEKGENKYIFLPNYQGYQKSLLLYNYSVAKEFDSEDCYLVEGFFDVISLTRLGLSNCIALLGTNCSLPQVNLLRLLKKRIVIFLDGDKAGREASIKITLFLLQNDIDCEVVDYDYEGDPDELCHRYNKEALLKIISVRKNPFLFILEYYYNSLDIKENPQRILRYISEISRIFINFKKNIKQFLIDKISFLTGWKKEEIFAYYIPFFSPRLHVINYLQENIKNKEVQLINFCFYRRDFWIRLSRYNYFFEDKRNRELYCDIYNYYILSPTKNNFLETKRKIFPEEIESIDPSLLIQKIFDVKQYIYQIKEY